MSRAKTMHQYALFWPSSMFFSFLFLFHSILFLAQIFFLLDPSCCPHCPQSTSNLLILRAETTHQITLFWPQVCAILFFLLFFTNSSFGSNLFFFTKSLMSPMLPVFYLQLPYFKGWNNVQNMLFWPLSMCISFSFYFLLIFFFSLKFFFLLNPSCHPHCPRHISKFSIDICICCINWDIHIKWLYAIDIISIKCFLSIV